VGSYFLQRRGIDISHEEKDGFDLIAPRRGGKLAVSAKRADKVAAAQRKEKPGVNPNGKEPIVTPRKPQEAKKKNKQLV